MADRAQSELVGGMLLLGVVVIVVGVAGVAALDATTATADAPQADVTGVVGTNATTLAHRGGESLPGADLRLLVAVDGADASIDWADGSLSGDDDVFDPGEQWTVTTPTSDSGAVVSITLIHRPSNAVLFETETNPTPPRVAAGDGGLADATDRDGRIDPGDVGGGGGTETPEPPDGEPAPENGGAFVDEDGDGLYDPGEATYNDTKDLSEFDDENADLIIPSEFGTISEPNQEINIRAASITTNADISSANAPVTLTATDGDVDATDATITSDNQHVTIEASGTVDVSDADVSADNGDTTIRASRILLTNGQITSQNREITLETTGDGDGEIVADGATISSDNSGVTLTTSNDRDLSIRNATVTSANGPVLVDSAGELDATGATITGNNRPVTLRSSGGDLSIRNADVDSTNRDIRVDSAAELDATDASLSTTNGNVETVSRGDTYVDGATLTARSVTADLGGPHTLHLDGTTVNDDDDRIAYTPVDVQEDPPDSNAAGPA